MSFDDGIGDIGKIRKMKGSGIVGYVTFPVKGYPNQLKLECAGFEPLYCLIESTEPATYFELSKYNMKVAWELYKRDAVSDSVLHNRIKGFEKVATKALIALLLYIGYLVTQESELLTQAKSSNNQADSIAITLAELSKMIEMFMNGLVA